MKKRGRVMLAAMAIMVAAGVASVPVFASENVVKKPEVSIKTEKEVYQQGEDIDAVIEIRNVTAGALENLKLSGDVPKGYTTEKMEEDSKKWYREISEIQAGKTAEVSVSIKADKKIEDDVKEEEEKKPTEHSKVQKETVHTSTDKMINADKDTSTNEVIQTNDDNNIICWIILGMFGLVIFSLAIRKQRGKRFLALFLVIAVSGLLQTTDMLSVYASESEAECKVDAQKEIMVNGEKLTLSVQVSYKEKQQEKDENTLSYEGYELKWSDDFEGDALNLNDWNIETHDPGWVNNELQEYTDSSQNIYVKDGKLVLKPIKTVDETGTVRYTSGRVNTQNKHDFKYGLFEAKVKVPKGQGFLPAFWMMPTNENLYGQWPRCGEIDIMEVLGNQTNTSYGTIHYGNPHSESQGNYTLVDGDFSEEYHVFSAEWEPGKITWYVDGNRIHTESDWYSATEGQGEITYPAPFDQPFYMILNLAVGGNWPGNPDETTDINQASYYIDYVKVYQKDYYDEDVQKPEKEVVLREPDANGNYINNGDFSEKEDLTDDTNWKFLTALGGVAEAEIKQNEIEIVTENEGTVDYSVQLVQANLPMKRGGTYEVKFDAYADEERTMKVDVSAPERSYKRYLSDTNVALTTQKQTYSYTFEMTDKDDANGRLEFNLGKAGSTATVRISNVSVKKVSERNLDENQEKTVRADGNYVYNGSFQEGEKRLGYWDISNNVGAEVSVTNENNIRRLKVVAPEGISAQNPVIISQSGLAFLENKDYAVSFLAEGDAGKHVKAMIAGQEYQAELTGKEQSYNYKITTNSDNKDIAFEIDEPGTFYLDDIHIVEDSLIKNGDFSAGFAGYDTYVDSSIASEVSYVVDSLTENNAADFIIGNTGDAAWKIQLKQNHIELENGQWYRLTLDAKSDVARKIMFAIQRDGSTDDDWTPYSGEKIVELGSEYQTYELAFKMNHETDLKSILSISMGAVDGVQITQKHRVCIDNIKLEKIEEPEVPEQPVGENLLKNGDFLNGNVSWENVVAGTGIADVVFEDGKAVYGITNVGDEDWNVQLKQNGILLQQGGNYKLTFHAMSTETRTVKAAMLSASYTWYGGKDIVLEAGVETTVEVEFPMNGETDTNTTLAVSMGQMKDETGGLIDTPTSQITLSEFSLSRVQ